MSDAAGQPASLRAEQVAQTRGALVAAGRRLFGEKGFRATSVEDLAREARVTTGALYHHFPTKTALFEAVFMQAHTDLMTASTKAAQGASDGIDELARGFEAFLDGVLQPDMQRILIVDGPAVLGLARYTELDEQYAHAVIVHSLTAAAEAGTITVEDPETWVRPWSGEESWPTTGALMYEYACHEGNYALPNILAGARAQEKQKAD